MYVIMRRNGWVFASEGCDYIVVNPTGQTVYREMHKLRAEQEFKRLVNGG